MLLLERTFSIGLTLMTSWTSSRERVSRPKASQCTKIRSLQVSKIPKNVFCDKTSLYIKIIKKILKKGSSHRLMT